MQDNPFSKLFNRRYIPDIRTTLTKRGTMLDDIVLHQLFYLMAWKKPYTEEQVRLVDSIILHSALHYHKSDVKHLRVYFTQLPLPPLILVPLVGKDHWSLLLYRPLHNRWYHLDSLSPFHTTLARQTVESLVKLTIVPRHASIRTVPHLPLQDACWECGLYLLQYALIAIASSVKAHGDEKVFQRELGLHNEIACEGNLLLFTQALLELLRQVEGGK